MPSWQQPSRGNAASRARALRNLRNGTVRRAFEKRGASIALFGAFPARLTETALYRLSSYVIPMRNFLLHLTAFLAVMTASAAPVDFNRDIRPILSNKCFKCHGPDEKERKGGKEGGGGLRLDTEEGSRADLGEAIAIVPGDPAKSELISRITTAEKDDVMPPVKSGRKLSGHDVEMLTEWVKAGGRYTKHWSYEKPRRVDPPIAAENPIDGFILARVAAEGLVAQPQADRTTLIRRVTLDLTGLPPTVEEVDAFVNDAGAGAYERLVDRLLASPAFGEHWARQWLDLARYADSAGYANDPSRTIWAFRDYVIRSFNANKPFDQFTIEQIAGDLLPNPTEDQLIATAFHRNTMTNSEGGTSAEEFRNAAIVDRVNTTMAVWMGTSMACAQCHSHKYDPITQTEYFRMFAILNGTEDANRADESPLLKFNTEEQKAQRRQIEADIAAEESKFTTPGPELLAAADAWAAAFPTQIGWRTLVPGALKSEAGVAMEQAADGVVVAKGSAAKDTYTIDVPFAENRRIGALRLEALPEESLPGKGPGLAAGNFVVTRVRASVKSPDLEKGPRARFVRIELPGKARLLQLAEVQVFSGSENVALKGEASQKSTYADAVAARAIDGTTAGEYDKGSVAHTADGDDPWWEVDLKSEQQINRIVVWNRAELGDRLNGFRVVALNEQRQSVWEKADNVANAADTPFALDGGHEIKLADATADFEQKDFEEDTVAAGAPRKEPRRGKKVRGPQAGWAIGGGLGAPHSLILLAAEPVDVAAGAVLSVSIEQQSPYPNHLLGSFRLASTDDGRVAEQIAPPASVVAALAAGLDQRSAVQRKEIAEYYIREAAPALAEDRQKQAALRQQLDAIGQYTVPIERELAASQRRKTRLQLRGNYQALADEVTEGLPSAFPPAPAGAPMNRLTLARWLVDENNPLTSRVVANRFWEAIFGIGIVRTSEEFGAQGEPPSHPELLDWLATELVVNKWDIKHFLNLLVTSATYRQSSKVTPELVERDPENRLLARGPRFRMSAEMVRDQALAVSGLLSRKMYGPSVRPARPSLGLSAAFGGGLDWKTSDGEDQHRRGVYTEWRRTSPYPSMATFDAPNREVCTLRRTRTNTPLQALVTMNDPVYVEAAQALARRLAAAAPAPDDRMRLAFRIVLSRAPSESELRRLTALHDDALATFKDDPKRAAEMAANPLGAAPPDADLAELAAWTTVAGVLLNLDETVMKR